MNGVNPGFEVITIMISITAITCALFWPTLLFLVWIFNKSKE